MTTFRDDANPRPVRTVTHGSTFRASTGHPRWTPKSLQNLMPFWSPIWLTSGALSGTLWLQKVTKNRSKNHTDFRSNFPSLLASKTVPKWSPKSSPGPPNRRRNPGRSLPKNSPAPTLAPKAPTMAQMARFSLPKRSQNGAQIHPWSPKIDPKPSN